MKVILDRQSQATLKLMKFLVLNTKNLEVAFKLENKPIKFVVTAFTMDKDRNKDIKNLLSMKH